MNRDLVFSSTEGNCHIAKIALETMLPDQEIYFLVIDVWGCILNYEEQFKDPQKPTRMFLPTLALVIILCSLKVRQFNFLPYLSDISLNHRI